MLTWFQLHTKVAEPTPVASWIHTEDGRIARVRVTFDPREIVAAASLGPRCPSPSSPEPTAGSGWRCAGSSRSWASTSCSAPATSRRAAARPPRSPASRRSSSTSPTSRASPRRRSGLERCDALVNNAAIEYDTDQRAVSADLTRVRTAFETNVLGAWRTTHALLPLIRRSPHPRIVNVSSGGGSLTGMGAGTPAYHVTKAGLNALTRTLAAELRADRVLVNAICPRLDGDRHGRRRRKAGRRGRRVDRLGHHAPRRRPDGWFLSRRPPARLVRHPG